MLGSSAHRHRPNAVFHWLSPRDDTAHHKMPAEPFVALHRLHSPPTSFFTEAHTRTPPACCRRCKLLLVIVKPACCSCRVGRVELERAGVRCSLEKMICVRVVAVAQDMVPEFLEEYRAMGAMGEGECVLRGVGTLGVWESDKTKQTTHLLIHHQISASRSLSPCGRHIIVARIAFRRSLRPRVVRGT